MANTPGVDTNPGNISASFTDVPEGGLGMSRSMPFDMTLEGPWTVSQNAELANIVGFGIHGSGAASSYPEVRGVGKPGHVGSII